MKSPLLHKLFGSVLNPRNRLQRVRFCILLVAMAIVVLVTYEYLQHTIYDSLSADVSQQELSQLTLYERSYSTIAANYYFNALDSIESLASNNTTQADFTTNNTNDLSSNFIQQRTYQDQFTTLAGYASSGQLIAYAGSGERAYVDDVKTLSPALQKTIASHAPAITGAYTSSGAPVNVSFSAPVLNTSGMYVGTVVGTTSLVALASHVNYVSIHNFSDLIVDNHGDILVNGSRPVRTVDNIYGSEPILKILSGSTPKTVQETNFENQAVIAEGTAIPIGNAGSIAVVSFLSQNGSAVYVHTLEHSVDSVSSLFIALNVVFFGIVAFLLLGIVRRRQKLR